jgi:AlkA-like protein/HhH-GPD superfamily base excision DNA repair protein
VIEELYQAARRGPTAPEPPVPGGPWSPVIPVEMGLRFVGGDNVVDVWEQERYLRVLATEDELALVEVANHGTIDAPDVRFVVLRGNSSPAALATLGQTVRKMLGLDVDPESLQALAETERRLRPTALALRGVRPPRFAGLFEAFANVVPFQQVSLDAGVAIVRRLVERFGKSVEHDGARFHAFPTAQVIANARVGTLRECGLSLRKAETLHKPRKRGRARRDHRGKALAHGQRGGDAVPAGAKGNRPLERQSRPTARSEASRRVSSR